MLWYKNYILLLAHNIYRNLNYLSIRNIAHKLLIYRIILITFVSGSFSNANLATNLFYWTKVRINFTIIIMYLRSFLKKIPNSKYIEQCIYFYKIILSNVTFVNIKIIVIEILLLFFNYFNKSFFCYLYYRLLFDSLYYKQTVVLGLDNSKYI